MNNFFHLNVFRQQRLKWYHLGYQSFREVRWINVNKGLTFSYMSLFIRFIKFVGFEIEKFSATVCRCVNLCLSWLIMTFSDALNTFILKDFNGSSIWYLEATSSKKKMYNALTFLRKISCNIPVLSQSSCLS